jgi:hypothetical protein
MSPDIGPLKPGSNRTDQKQIEDHTKSESRSRSRSGSFIGRKTKVADHARHFPFDQKQLETRPIVRQEQEYYWIGHSDWVPKTAQMIFSHRNAVYRIRRKKLLEN